MLLAGKDSLSAAEPTSGVLTYGDDTQVNIPVGAATKNLLVSPSNLNSTTLHIFCSICLLAPCGGGTFGESGAETPPELAV